MTKESLLKELRKQSVNPKHKTTKRAIIKVVADMVEHHIKDNAEISGISPNRSGEGYNLGDIVEVVLHSLARNKIAKSDSNKHYDIQVKGEKAECKWATSDAGAKAIYKNAVVDYYLIATYTAKLGGIVFKVPYAQRDEINTYPSGRITPNQKAKFIDKEWTKRVFAF